MKKIPSIPIEVLVVSANRKAVLRAENKNLQEIVVRKNYLAMKFEEISKKHPCKILPKKEIKKQANFLLRSNTFYIPNLLETYHISPDDLATGVQCPKCMVLPMFRAYGKWVCGACSFFSRDAHLAALRDYALLIKSTITNRELRKFLHIESEFVATRLLQSLNLPYTGNERSSLSTELARFL